ncbi:MAG: HRDC domain-containing protein, partial [Devosia sp.]
MQIEHHAPAVEIGCRALEMERLADPDHYRNDPSQIWRKIRAPSRNPHVLGRLKDLAAWREQEAQGKNIPRGRIMRDEALADIASHPPKEQADIVFAPGAREAAYLGEIG